MTLFSISLRARDVAERPGDVRLRRPERSGDIRTVRTRQGLNIQKKDIHRMSLFYIFESTRRDSNPTRKKLCLILLYFRKDFKHFSLGVVIL